MARDDLKPKTGGKSLKFLCSYGGKIIPRTTDSNLCYVGGLTRVFSVDRNISFADLMLKLDEFCGYSVSLRCQLPNGDLETLISVKSDEDLAIIVDEYRKIKPDAKIRAVLSSPSSLKRVSPSSSVDLSPKSPFSSIHSPTYVPIPSYRRSPPTESQKGVPRRFGEARCYGCHTSGIPRIPHYTPLSYSRMRC